MAVSDETKDLLEHVKKGKPRKFVMLTKGVNIVSLVLFKKGSISAFIKEAKEAGTGIPCFGTAAGKGPDIRFQLASDDGFDKPPLKDTVLKKYLEEEADFKCKPWFEIVATLEPMLDPTDPLHARFIKLKEAAAEAGKADTGKVKELAALCKTIGKLLEEDQRDAATVQMTALEKLLPSSSSTTGTSEKSTTPAADKAETTYWALRDKLEDGVKKAQAAGPKGEAIVKLFNYADAQANVGGFANANKALANVAEALKKPASEGTTTTTETPGPTTSGSTTGTTTSSEVPPTAPPQPPQPGPKPKTEGSRGGGRAFYQLWSEAKKGWTEASEKVDDQLAALGSKLKASGDADYKDIAEQGLTSITGGLKTPLMAAIMGVDGATGTSRGKAIDKARKAAEAFRKHIDSDERVTVCDENPFDVPVSISSTLGEALDKLDEALAVGV
jgi:hypothetical protein